MACFVDLMGHGQTTWASIRGGHDGPADQITWAVDPLSVGGVLSWLSGRVRGWTGGRIMSPYKFI